MVAENPTENAPPEDGPDRPKTETAPLRPFTVEILNLIKEAQQQHGLKHGDYQRYRGYCSRRIRRLRKVLKLPQGERRHFKRRDVTEAHVSNARSDERFLHVPLMLAERCWAHAMQLRQEANTEPRKKFHLVQKLRKACVYALQLEELCKQERCDARTKLEAGAYSSWAVGTLHFELQQWRRAGESLRRAQLVYERLAGTLPEARRPPYRQRADEIAPSLRYCAYNMGDEPAVGLLELRSQGVLENFDALVSQSKEKVADVLYEVKWFDLVIPVRIEKIRLFLESIEGLDESLAHAEDGQARVHLLEDVLSDLRDVVSLAREAVRVDREAAGEAQALLSYLLSVRVDRTSQRNLVLVAQARRPQDCVRLLDINVQQTGEMAQGEAVRNNSSIKDHYESQIAAYKALRYYYLGKSQAAQKRWKEAAVLFDKASRSVKSLKKANSVTELANLLDTVQQKSSLDLATAKANIELDRHEEPPQPPQRAPKTKKPLSERLDEFREEPQLLSRHPNLVTLPPPMEAVPAKPLFFDLALNLVEFPDLGDKLEVGQPKKAPAAGLSGFVKGLWGWGNK